MKYANNVDVLNVRLKLIGVDMYEYQCKIVKVIFGLLAKEFVEQHLPVGSTQVLRTKKDSVGKYGRILGEFIAYDSKNDRQSTVNQLLIDTHNAVEYHGQSKEEIAEEHLRNRELVAYVDFLN